MFRKVFRSFRRVWTHSDPLGPVGMHLDAFGCIRKRLGAEKKSRVFFDFFRYCFENEHYIETDAAAAGAAAASAGTIIKTALTVCLTRAGAGADVSAKRLSGGGPGGAGAPPPGNSKFLNRIIHLTWIITGEAGFGFFG